MNYSANQQKQEAMRAGEELANQYHAMLDGWAEVSKCCLAAADDIYQTGIDYMKDQAEQLHEISCDPSAAMREQTMSKAMNCSFDAADRIAQAYLHSLENVREPLMRVVSAQLPMGRAMTQFMEKGLERSTQAMEEGSERMGRGMSSMMRSAERGTEEAQRGAEEAQQQHQAHRQQGKRKSA
ncbi:MAG TPA: hypothetical protein VF801_14985 [Rhodocyclaceae bacterium]